MRDFDRRQHSRGHRFGHHRMAKPLLLGVVLLLPLACW